VIAEHAEKDSAKTPAVLADSPVKNLTGSQKNIKYHYLVL